MTTNAKLTQYADQITEIAAFARSINFNIETGDVADLVRSYLNATAPVYKSGNSEKVMSIVKQFI